jgi:glycosyltransferase involved in cell wall biosynthesis
MRPLLSLVLLVKDESASIRKVLESALPFVDAATVLDTGSTDGTQDIVREVAAKFGQPIALVEEPFINFAESRNRALELDASAVRPTEFQLCLSADEFLQEGEDLRAYLAAHLGDAVDLFKLRLFIDETTFFTPRVFRTGSAWKYVGAVHECPMHPDALAPVSAIPNAWIEHHVSDPERRYANIWENHIPLLRAQLEENPEDARALVFLAQSYAALFPMFQPGERITFAMEAMSLYLRRLALPVDTDAERNYLRYLYLDAARYTGVYSEAEAFARCEELFKVDPHRPEVALLRVHAGARLFPATTIFNLACESAKVAHEAKEIQNDSPVSTSCEWMSHLLAASAAITIWRKHQDAHIDGRTLDVVIRDHAEAGLAADGPPEAFGSLLNELLAAPLPPVPEAGNSASA